MTGITQPHLPENAVKIADDYFNSILIKISLIFVPESPIDFSLALV